MFDTYIWRAKSHKYQQSIDDIDVELSVNSYIRVFYAFDPRRCAILLIGGDKTGNNRFYEEYIPIADRLYDVYLEELRQEGLIE